MMAVFRKLSLLNSMGPIGIFSSSPSRSISHQCKLLIIGGGTGGCVIANKLARRLKKDEIIVLEPSKDHYYQPLWTLVGAGVKTLADTRRAEVTLIPPKVKWLRDSAVTINPDKMEVSTECGDTIQYEYLLVATGLEIDYDRIPGLKEALDEKNSGVSTVYSPAYCEKTWADLQRFGRGEAVFTYPDTCIKCPGAPQKIAYMAEDYLTRNVTVPYRLLHVGPPMRAPLALRSSTLADAGGLLDVDKYTLQHVKYPNVFGIGDCTNTPNSKTAAAIAKQGPVVALNLVAAMTAAGPAHHYDGYGACPLVTGRGRCLLAEFLYDGVVHETFPFLGESRAAYYMKRDMFPFIYWNFMMKGNYNGPEFVRKIFHRGS